MSRTENEHPSLERILRRFPPDCSSQKMLWNVSRQFGGNEVIVGPRAQELLRKLRLGADLISREKGQLYQSLTSGLGRSPAHNSTIYARFSAEEAAKRIKEG